MTTYSKSLFFLVLSTVMLTGFLACEDDDITGTDDLTDLEINFRSTYGDDPLIMLQWYAYDDLQIRFTRFNYFLSDVVLLGQDGTDTNTELREIALLDFSEHTSESLSKEGITLLAEDLPAGDYAGIKFGFGVAPDLNRQRPNEFSEAHPLFDESHYWSGWESYIFSKIEGQVDVDSDGANDHGMVFHGGSDALYREVTLMENFTLERDALGNLQIQLDLKKMLGAPDAMFDFSTQEGSTDHQLDKTTVIADNVMRSFSVE